MDTEILPKKINVNLTIDEDLLKLCDDRAHNKSALVCKLLREYFFPKESLMNLHISSNSTSQECNEKVSELCRILDMKNNKMEEELKVLQIQYKTIQTKLKQLESE